MSVWFRFCSNETLVFCESLSFEPLGRTLISKAVHDPTLDFLALSRLDRQISFPLFAKSTAVHRGKDLFKRKRLVLAGCTSGGTGFRIIVCLKRSLSWMECERYVKHRGYVVVKGAVCLYAFEQPHTFFGFWSVLKLRHECKRSGYRVSSSEPDRSRASGIGVQAEWAGAQGVFGGAWVERAYAGCVAQARGGITAGDCPRRDRRRRRGAAGLEASGEHGAERAISDCACRRYSHRDRAVLRCDRVAAADCGA